MTGANVLLAFDMGTGKTPTTIYAIEKMREAGEIPIGGTGVILAPASLIFQWQREIQKFTTREVVVISGPPKVREIMYLTISAFDYVVMTYDTFVRDEKILLSKDIWEFLVLDEATAIKSFKTKRTMAVKRAMKKAEVRYALTGTPVENGKPEELFSILEFVDPEIAGPWWRFEKEHITRNSLGWIEGYRNIDRFHKRVRPNLLRKTIHDPEVSKYLPEVITPEPVYVLLDKATLGLYLKIEREILEDLDNLVEDMLSKWSDEDPDHPDGKMMAKIQTARMLLDHPVAVYTSAARFEDPDDDRGSQYAADLVKEGHLDKVTQSPKFDAFVEYLNEYLDRDPGNKVVVFCSFVDVAQHIHDSMPLSSVLFTGSMSPKDRDAAVHRFKGNPEIRVFVSTDAGGYGLDLPEANLLINYDLPWQAGLLKQRNARIRRASSEWEHVVVQDFIVQDTIEERLADMLRHKIAVSDAFVDGEGILDDGTLGSSLDSLRSFLRSLSDPHEKVSRGASGVDDTPMMMDVP